MNSAYSKRGDYSGYDKKNKERDALDYYATPSQEVTNILNQTGINFTGKTILEPSCGGLHMVKGIVDYLVSSNQLATIIATDVQERDTLELYKIKPEFGLEYDFLSENYPYNDVDWIIMNPPYGTLEGHLLKALECAAEGILVLGRMQALEGKSRFENVWIQEHLSDVWVYVDRINCYKSGNFNIKQQGVQAYAWFLFYPKEIFEAPKLHWIRRI